MGWGGEIMGEINDSLSGKYDDLMSASERLVGMGVGVCKAGERWWGWGK